MKVIGEGNERKGGMNLDFSAFKLRLLNLASPSLFHVRAKPRKYVTCAFFVNSAGGIDNIWITYIDRGNFCSV